MTNLVVISFASEEQAIDASHKLVELESFGDITVYEKVIVKKDSNGGTAVLETDTSNGLRTLSGMSLGTLIGALAGPVGLLVGIISGTLTGAALESRYFDFSQDFISKVTNQLQPGTVAIIAEIYEENPAFMDSALDPFGATVSRSNVDYEYDEYIDDRIKEIDDKIAAERSKIKSSVAAEKSKIQQKIVQLKEKQKAIIAKIRAPKKARSHG